MQNDRRQFYIYDLEIAARKAGASIPTMDDLLPVFQKMKDSARVYSIRSNTATMLLGDMEIDAAQQVVTLLVRLSDKTTPNSVYSDPAAGQFSVHVKKNNEGSDFGCHVIVSTAQERGVPNTYTCAVERISGLAPDLVKRLLSKLLNFQFKDDPASFSYPHPGGGSDRDGRLRMDRCCPHIELRGRPSDTLISDINNGRVTGIALVRAEAITPIAGAPYLRKSESELRLQIDHNSLPANLWQSLRGVFQTNSANYGVAKVSYKVPGTERRVTVEIDTRTGNPLQEMYVESFELLNINPFLDQSAPQIVRHLTDPAVSQLLNHRTI